MLMLPSSVKIWLATEPADMRRGHDGLMALAKTNLGLDPYAGHLVVFLGKRRDRCKIVFFDRGVPDIAGYLSLCGLPVSQAVERAARECRYRRSVFIAPPWPEIFVGDAERKQDFAEAQRTYEAMLKAYPRFGYALLELPRASIGERVAFMMRHLAAPA